MTTTTGLRARNRERVRRTIEDAALRLFVANGFEATTVDEIAAAADVSPRTFFNYFPTKEEVVLGPQRDRYDELGAAIARQPREVDLLDAIGAGIHELAVSLSDGSNVHARMQTIARSPALLGRQAQIRDRWIASIAEAVARRDGRTTPDQRDVVAANVAIGVLSASLTQWIEHGGRSNLGAVIDANLAELRSLAAGWRA